MSGQEKELMERKGRIHILKIVSSLFFTTREEQLMGIAYSRPASTVSQFFLGDMMYFLLNRMVSLVADKLHRRNRNRYTLLVFAHPLFGQNLRAQVAPRAKN